MNKKQKNPNMVYLHLLLGIAFTLLMKYIPGPGGITELGMVVIAVFIVLNVWSSTIGLVSGAISALLLFLIASGQSASTMITSLLGNSTVYQILIMFGVVATLRITGVTDALAHWLLTRKVFKNSNPRRFLFFYFIVAACFAIFKVHTLVGLALADGIMKAAGYEERTKEYTAFISVAFFLQCTSGSVIPFGSQILAMVNAFEPVAGIPMELPVFMAVGFFVVCCNIIVMTFALTTIFKCDYSKLTNVDTSNFSGTLNGSGEFTKAGRHVFGVFCFMIFGVIVASFFKSFFLSVFINKITTSMWFTLTLAVMLLVPIDGKPVVNANSLFKESVQWPVFWSVSVMIYLTSWISNDDTGIKAALGTAFSTIFTGMSPTLILICVVFVTMVVTSFFANMPTAIMMMSATVPMASSLGVNPIALGVCIMWASIPGVLTPGGSGYAPYIHSLTTITKKDMFKTLLMCLCSDLIALVIVGAVIGVIMPV